MIYTKFTSLCRSNVTKRIINFPSCKLTLNAQSIGFIQNRCYANPTSKDKLVVFDTSLRDGEQVFNSDQFNFIIN